ncbi:hypothetical protein N7516_000300 [Penicillium verrucosum]|uniref:uncharacterized protein n=1 Tax=Penicillium verrucosum TaxID=60171 RepID=UPI0025456A9C|nr:uncharacterized protein N7516_000300 [Penicillium verrucosum]KAJ5940132.1 hypothetical protein N7516_000300 [Penicillium verrucosum]
MSSVRTLRSAMTGVGNALPDPDCLDLSAATRQLFADYWGVHISWLNLNPYALPPARNERPVMQFSPAERRNDIGTIPYTFDNPNPALPYRAGYRHDLSLIIDNNLPTLVSPPGYPVVSEWASYSASQSG